MFDHPAALWLLILAPLADSPAVAAIIRGARMAGAASLACRLALLAVLVALLAGFRIKGTTAARSVEVVAVLDESRSIARDQSDWMYHLLHEVARLLNPRDRLGVVGFGRDAQLAVPPSDPRLIGNPMAHPDPGAHYIADELTAAQSLFSTERVQRLW